MKRNNDKRIFNGAQYVGSIPSAAEEHVPRLKAKIAEFRQHQSEERKQHVIE